MNWQWQQEGAGRERSKTMVHCWLCLAVLGTGLVIRTPALQVGFFTTMIRVYASVEGIDGGSDHSFMSPLTPCRGSMCSSLARVCTFWGSAHGELVASRSSGRESRSSVAFFRRKSY